MTSGRDSAEGNRKAANISDKLINFFIKCSFSLWFFVLLSQRRRNDTEKTIGMDKRKKNGQDASMEKSKRGVNHE
jgi:hypothetical protein